ncbi:hypothetical protein P7K49_000011 [Saguinus oedipus]|uniref:Uncharacterized protein n=1 Tax=Saguinus oedipus TaxID=9490 RepID=A0ABQ9WAE2_SAGOE|nr:hypothetical protein P7K49_000011 [Saguinus oedipus]
MPVPSASHPPPCPPSPFPPLDSWVFGSNIDQPFWGSSVGTSRGLHSGVLRGHPPVRAAWSRQLGCSESRSMVTAASHRVSLPPRYFLQPRDNGSKSLKPDDLGSLRLNVVYTEDHVFSSDYYRPLRDLLLKSADVEPVSASAAHILGEVCREKQEAAVPLVRLFLHYGRVVPFISAIASAEESRWDLLRGSEVVAQNSILALGLRKVEGPRLPQKPC